jgi:hypothetical protein
MAKERESLLTFLSSNGNNRILFFMIFEPDGYINHQAPILIILIILILG